MSPWQVITSLLNNKTPTQEEIKTLNSFFLVRWLSNNKFTLPIASYINLYYNIPSEIQYQFAEDYIHLTGLKNKVKFIYYKKQETEEIQLLNTIKEKYKINEKQAQEYYNIIKDKPSEIKKLEMYQNHN